MQKRRSERPGVRLSSVAYACVRDRNWDVANIEQLCRFVVTRSVTDVCSQRRASQVMEQPDSERWIGQEGGK